MLVLEAIDRMRRFEDRLSRDAFDDCFLEPSRRLVCGDVVSEGFNSLDRVLNVSDTYNQYQRFERLRSEVTYLRQLITK